MSNHKLYRIKLQKQDRTGRLKQCASLLLIQPSSTFMAFWGDGSVDFLLWWGTEEGVEIRGGEVTSQVKLGLESFTWDPQSATKQPVILTAICEMNTFQGFLGSLSALASISNTKSVCVFFFFLANTEFSGGYREVSFHCTRYTLYKKKERKKRKKLKTNQACWPPIGKKYDKKSEEEKGG